MLQELERYPVYTLDLSTMYADAGHRSPEEACVQVREMTNGRLVLGIGMKVVLRSRDISVHVYILILPIISLYSLVTWIHTISLLSLFSLLFSLSLLTSLLSLFSLLFSLSSYCSSLYSHFSYLSSHFSFLSSLSLSSLYPRPTF